MQFLRTAFWVVIAVALALFCVANYTRVEVNLWGDLVMETKLPVLLIGEEAGLIVAELALITFIAVVGYIAARGIPLSRPRSLLFVAGVVALTLVVIGVKNLAHY